MSIINWIKDYIESLGIQTTVTLNNEKIKASLHCRIGPPLDGGTILSGHTDVVPVTGQKWNTDPFVLTDINDGNLYGRGTCDMKGFLACCLNALPKMKKANLKTPIYLAFSFDEEIGCLGTPHILSDIAKTYTEKPKQAIIGEPTMMQPMLGQKGIFCFDTHVNGLAGHSSGIKSGVSAVHEAARLIMWLESKMDLLIAEGHLDQRFDPPHTTLHIGKMNGGVAPNVIANQASFSCDLRTIPKDNVSDTLGAYQEYCESREDELRAIFPGFKIQIKKYMEPLDAFDTDEDLPIVHLIKKVTGHLNTSTVSFGSEAAQFSLAGYDSVICGPGSIQQAHTENEFISMDQLTKGEKMINRIIHEMC